MCRYRFANSLNAPAQDLAGKLPTAGGWALALSVPGPLCRKDRHSSLVRLLETLLLARDNGLANWPTGFHSTAVMVAQMTSRSCDAVIFVL